MKLSLVKMRYILLMLFLFSLISTSAQEQVRSYKCRNGLEVKPGDTIFLNKAIEKEEYTAIYKDKPFGKNSYLSKAQEPYLVVKRIYRYFTKTIDETAYLKVYGKTINNYTIKIDEAIEAQEVILPVGFVSQKRKLSRDFQYTASNGKVFTVGDPITIGKGSASKGKFKYLCKVFNDVPEVFYSQSFNSVHNYGSKSYAGQKFYIQKIHYYKMEGESKVYFLVAKRLLQNYVLDIENAILTCEIADCK